MSKPIEFEPVKISDIDGDTIEVGTGDYSACIRTSGVIQLTDPARLDALADACKRAADTLRKSQQVTFGDLKPGEFFGMDGASGTYMKAGSNDSGMGQPPNGLILANHRVYDAYIGLDTPVVRLKATFSPVEEK